jgi:transposase InsO family protein
MQLCQLDITGSVFLTDGTELKLISGIDDHSRFCVIATVVRRATARAVCRTFITAMRTYGIPDEVLSDNGKQFTERFGKPRPTEGAVRANLPPQRHPAAAHQAVLADHNREGGTLAPDPPTGAPQRRRAVRRHRGSPGRHRCVARGVQPAPAAPVPGHDRLADRFSPSAVAATSCSCGRQLTWNPL